MDMALIVLWMIWILSAISLYQQIKIVRSKIKYNKENIVNHKINYFDVFLQSLFFVLLGLAVWSLQSRPLC